MPRPEDRPTRCLLVVPRFSDFSFWNLTPVYHLSGHKYLSAPLGLLTVAGMLPRDWELRLADLNCRPLSDEEIDWADLVMAGSMIIQQLATADLIRRVHARGRPIAVGGPDPTSQPWLYEDADFLVLDEGESTVPLFLRAWEAGERRGTFRASGPRPDLRTSPVPRYDLARHEDYLYIGVQSSRGCPHACEFCDIVKLFGRSPRYKEPGQVLAELEALLAAGYRGHVDIADDNLIADKRAAKELLRRLEGWSRERGWPFFFSGQVSLDLASDEELLDLVGRCDFRYLFVGIETPDPALLLATHKKQNLLAPVSESVSRIHAAGPLVMAGFILGFDGEKAGAARAVARCVEETGVCVAMVGLLTSLPGTELDRRLRREGRLLIREGGAKIEPGETDQMTGGLNFLPLRPRREILREYRDALASIYSVPSYFGRIRRSLSAQRPRWRHRGELHFLPRALLTGIWISLDLLVRPSAALDFLWTLLTVIPRGPAAAAACLVLSGYYLHLERQTSHVIAHLGRQIADVEAFGEEEFNRRRGVHIAPQHGT